MNIRKKLVHKIKNAKYEYYKQNPTGFVVISACLKIKPLSENSSLAKSIECKNVLKIIIKKITVFKR